MKETELCEACVKAPVPGALWPMNGRAEVQRCDDCRRLHDDLEAAVAVMDWLNGNRPESGPFSIVIEPDPSDDGPQPRLIYFVAVSRRGGSFRELTEEECQRALEGAEMSKPESEKESEGLLEDILQAARAHGEESDPDHEVGDLQIALRLAWAGLSPEAQREVHSTLSGTNR